MHPHGIGPLPQGRPDHLEGQDRPEDLPDGKSMESRFCQALPEVHEQGRCAKDNLLQSAGALPLTFRAPLRRLWEGPLS